MHALRWVAIAAAALVALLVVGAVVAYATIDTQAIVRYASDEVQRLTGRTVVARGPVTIAFWPRLAVVANDVSISQPPGAAVGELAHAKTVRAAVAIWPLLRSRVIVAEAIELHGLDVSLEARSGLRAEAASGASRAPASPPGAATAPPAAPPAAPATQAPFRLGGAVVIVDAKVTWRPPDGGNAVVVTIPRLEVAPRDDGRHVWRGQVEVDRTLWNVDVATGDPQMFYRDRVPLDVDATFTGGGVKATAKGRVERRDTGPGAVVDVVVTWDAGSEWMSRRSPVLAHAAGQVSTRVDAREGQVALGAIAGSVAGTKFDGNLDIETGGKVPRVGGRLHADLVDVATLRRPGNAAGAAAGAADEPAAVTRLADADVDVDFVVDRLRVAEGVEATNARGRVVVAGGRLAADPLDVDFAGGRIAGNLHADAATRRGRLVVTGRGIEFARVSAKLDPGRSTTGGATTFAIDLQGPVQAPGRFVAGASGSVSVDVGPLRIQGIALDAGGEVASRVLDALNPFRRVDPSTEIQCFVARLAVIDGVAHADRTIAIETGRLVASASGTIDLGRETLDLLVRPHVRKIASLSSVTLPEVVRVSGPIRQPSVRIDKLGAAKAALTIGGAVASGGWSLLATPLLSAGEDPNPCATARAGGKVSGTAPASPGAAAGKAADDLLAPLRGLFKRN